MKQLLTLLLIITAISCTEKKEENRNPTTLVVIQGSDTTRTQLPDGKYSIYFPEGQYVWDKKDTIRIVYTQFNNAIRICYADTFIRVSKIISNKQDKDSVEMLKSIPMLPLEDTNAKIDYRGDGLFVH